MEEVEVESENLISAFVQNISCGVKNHFPISQVLDCYPVGK